MDLAHRRLRYIGAVAAVLACMWLLVAASAKPALKMAPVRMKQEFDSELRKRKIESGFSEYQNHVLEKVQQTHRTDKCRLRWIEKLIQHPVQASQTAEEFTARLYDLSRSRQPMDPMIQQLAEKLDISQIKPVKTDPEKDPFVFMAHKIRETENSLKYAYRKLSGVEMAELRSNIYNDTTLEGIIGYRFGGEDRGARVIDLLLRVDLQGISEAANHLSALSNGNFHRNLMKLYRQQKNNSTLREIETADGVILIGGEGPNIYNLDQFPHVRGIVDFGGDDVYNEGDITQERPVFAILDLDGNDVYRGRKSGIQGGAILGASLLYDRLGDDRYESYDVAQGSALSGVGILIDEEGDDTYMGDRRVQGQAIHGFGILFDGGGRDDYRAALFAQGVGGPLGAGLLVDHSGDDHYFAGGKYPDSYNESPGFGSWSQGIGVGARDVANGGIGVLLDGSGNDQYEADYFSHGGGYWTGAGFLRDFDGNDQRFGPVRSNFDGTKRTEPRYARWTIGFGCHYAAGFVFDDRGIDWYRGDWAAIAYAWDVSIGAVFDGDGNDRYSSKGSGVAHAANSSFAVLCDLRGNDSYVSKHLGFARKEKSLYSFAILLDRGGRDMFTKPVGNDTSLEKGWTGGVLIDR